MIIQPSEFPGSHERHLLRKASNPLFEELQVELSDEALLGVQQLDHELAASFSDDFQALLEQSGTLDSNVDSEKVLLIKDRLDQAYETASAIAGEHSEACSALSKLLSIVMAAIRQGAGNDAKAHHELDQEENARQAHFQLLESPLVADLLNPQSVISARELLPVCLSADKEEILLAVQLFDISQLEILLGQGVQLLERIADDHASEKQAAQEKLYWIQGYIEFLKASAEDD